MLQLHKTQTIKLSTLERDLQLCLEKWSFVQAETTEEHSAYDAPVELVATVPLHTTRECAHSEGQGVNGVNVWITEAVVEQGKTKEQVTEIAIKATDRNKEGQLLGKEDIATAQAGDKLEACSNNTTKACGEKLIGRVPISSQAETTEEHPTYDAPVELVATVPLHTTRECAHSEGQRVNGVNVWITEAVVEQGKPKEHVTEIAIKATDRNKEGQLLGKEDIATAQAGDKLEACSKHGQQPQKDRVTILQAEISSSNHISAGNFNWPKDGAKGDDTVHNLHEKAWTMVSSKKVTPDKNNGQQVEQIFIKNSTLSAARRNVNDDDGKIDGHNLQLVECNKAENLECNNTKNWAAAASSKQAYPDDNAEAQFSATPPSKNEAAKVQGEQFFNFTDIGPKRRGLSPNVPAFIPSKQQQLVSTLEGVSSTIQAEKEVAKSGQQRALNATVGPKEKSLAGRSQLGSGFSRRTKASSSSLDTNFSSKFKMSYEVAVNSDSGSDRKSSRNSFTAMFGTRLDLLGISITYWSSLGQSKPTDDVPTTTALARLYKAVNGANSRHNRQADMTASGARINIQEEVLNKANTDNNQQTVAGAGHVEASINVPATVGSDLEVVVALNATADVPTKGFKTFS
ncbi:hypothetical protein A4A49_30386 [Nicotiana attenuata]|uniref:Uncharacterized protein n=1 Tax=Nicotiana attenuata TaxID=49451 RepID=A0A1J6IAV3_NICAT|nr:hypothetical protein A4A49_30386 [Nicotiana attenuata]